MAAAVVVGELTGVKCPEGPAPRRVELRDGRGGRAVIASVGATLVSLEKDGAELTVAPDRSELPCPAGTYAGASCGRVANRIANAEFELDGRKHKVTANAGSLTLHGGKDAFHMRHWDLLDTFQTDAEVGVLFGYTSKDGEEGFPGELAVTARYALTLQGGPETCQLSVVYEAELPEDGAATVVNICNHVYWNLSGKPASSIKEHTLQTFCPSYIAVDDDSVPVGTVANVAGTPFDFCNAPVALGERIDKVGRELHGEHHGVDHCLAVISPDEGDSVLADTRSESYTVGSGTEDIPVVAVLHDPSSGRELTVATTQPGMQVYTANWMPGEFKHASVALETQFFPDSINQEKVNPRFEGTILRHGQKFRSATVYSVACE